MSVVMSKPVVQAPLSTRRTIAEALESAHEEAVEYWSEYGTSEFFAPMGGSGRRRSMCAI